MWKNKSVATDCALHTPYYLMISRLEDGLGIGGGDLMVSTKKEYFDFFCFTTADSLSNVTAE